MNTYIWVIGNGVLEFKRNFLQVPVVTTHVEWAKLTGTKVGWNSCIVNLFRDFRATTGAKLITFLYKEKSSTPMTRVIYYNVFLKKKINEQALVDYAKHSMWEYKDAMKQDWEKYVWIYDESLMGNRDVLENELSMISICHKVNPTSENIRSIPKYNNMVMRQVYREIQSCKVLWGARLWQWLSHERFWERLKKMMLIWEKECEVQSSEWIRVLIKVNWWESEWRNKS
jgi:hypothetical protein